MARIQLTPTTTAPEVDNITFGAADGLIISNTENISFENLDLVETRSINDILVHGYYYAKEAWFTRTEIGQALEYSDPQKAVLLIHQRHKERLDRFSRGYQIDTPSGKQQGYIYSFRGVFEICRWSTQPKANMVMDALYDMAQSVMENGYFSVMPDSELIEFLKQRCKTHPGTLNVVSANIKKELTQDKINQRGEKTEKIKELWIRRFSQHEDVNMFDELKHICAGDTTLFHKYIDRYQSDVRREIKGQLIAFKE